MTNTPTVVNERVDDLPILLAQMEHMQIADLLDKYFFVHGNRQGLSLGWTVSTWLSHILSEADHRLNHVQPWAERRVQTLCACIGQTVTGLDFTDDRLADVLTALARDAQWQEFEGALTQHLLRVYDLTPQRVRLDSSTASGYWPVTPDGLFQFGLSKDHRPDLPQVKVMLSSVDPLGLPVATQVVAGHCADDPLYVPAIDRVRTVLGRRGLVYIGDSKMGTTATRATLQAGGDFYLCPLPLAQLQPTGLAPYLEPIWAGQQALTAIDRQRDWDEPEHMAEGYEGRHTMRATVDGQTITWTERRLVIHSFGQAHRAEADVRARLAQVQQDIAHLHERKPGKTRLADLATLRRKADAIVQRYDVQGLLLLSYYETPSADGPRVYRRQSGNVRIEKDPHVAVTVDEQALAEAIRALGWRVYASNQGADRLSLTQAVLAYRSEYLIERGFGRLKGKPLSVTPMYLQHDNRATGLIRLLSIGLRVLTVVEFAVRARLAEDGSKLAGLYAGNPKRATDQPTSERLLEAFKEITLSTVHDRSQTWSHVTPLTVLQQRILFLLGFSSDLYTQISANLAQAP